MVEIPLISNPLSNPLFQPKSLHITAKIPSVVPFSVMPMPPLIFPVLRHT
jgi:hypothetical protein